MMTYEEAAKHYEMCQDVYLRINEQWDCETEGAKMFVAPEEEREVIWMDSENVVVMGRYSDCAELLEYKMLPLDLQGVTMLKLPKVEGMQFFTDDEVESMQKCRAADRAFLFYAY